MKSEGEVIQSCPALSDPVDCSLKAPPPMGFSRQEYWSGLPLPSQFLIKLLSSVWLCATLWTEACQASLSITNSWSLLKLMSIESVMPSNYLSLCHPFSSSLKSFPASGSFQMSQLFASGGQSVGVLASASVLPVNTQDWFPLGLTGWISLQVQGTLSQKSSPTPQFKSINSSMLSFLYSLTLTSIHDWTNHSFD